MNGSPALKPIEFLGDSLARLREFPEGARGDAGYELYTVQRGEEPSDTTERMKSFIRSVASATARRALWRESQGRGCARPATEGH